MDAAYLVQYKALSAPTPSPTRYFIFNFLIISFIFIENKCLYDAIWDLKSERKKKVRPIGQRWDRTTGRSRQKEMTCDLPSALLELMLQSTLLCFFWFFLYLDWQMSRLVSGE